MGKLARFIYYYTGNGDESTPDTEHTETGTVVRFTAQRAIPLIALSAALDTVQDGTGDPSPENIRPIIGWTGASLIVSPTLDDRDGTVYPFDWEDTVGAVYGGSFDVLTGVMTVTMANIESYNGETLPGVWISDRDVYEEGTIPTTGAQVVYELAEPLTYELTPTEVDTLVGKNNIWAITGNVTVTYIGTPATE